MSRQIKKNPIKLYETWQDTESTQEPEYWSPRRWSRKGQETPDSEVLEWWEHRLLVWHHLSYSLETSSVLLCLFSPPNQHWTQLDFTGKPTIWEKSGGRRWLDFCCQPPTPSPNYHYIGCKIKNVLFIVDGGSLIFCCSVREAQGQIFAAPGRVRTKRKIHTPATPLLWLTTNSH